MPKSKADIIVYKGIVFRRYPASLRWDSRMYYCPSAGHRRQGIGRLHQEIWKDAHGPIPEGHEIHHKDHNPLNNALDNLELLSSADHLAYHAAHSGMSITAWLQRVTSIKKATKAAVKWHGSEEGLAWHSENGRESWESRKPETRTCDACGTSFESKWHRSRGRIIDRFCSNKCKSAWRRQQRLDFVTKQCERCGKDFESHRYNHTRFCSRSCSGKGVLRTRRSSRVLFLR